MKTTYAVQEFFIGQWSDNFSSEDKNRAMAEYRKARPATPRRVRLIERVETVIEVDHKLVSEWARED